MLVLSRKENEKVLFPHLGIALQILRSTGGKVRLGIEAPGDVSVVRAEIASEEQISQFAELLKRSAKSLTHAVRNRLHETMLGMYVVQKQLALERFEEAEETLDHLILDLKGLDQELRPPPTTERAAEARRRR